MQAGGGKLQIWGCMSAEGVGEMRVIEGTMKSDNYIDVLEQEMVRSGEKLQKG